MIPLLTLYFDCYIVENDTKIPIFLIIGEMDKRYGEFLHILWKNLPYILDIQVDLGDLISAPTSVKTKQCGAEPKNDKF